MSKLGLRLVLAIGLGLSAATPLWADESAKSSPPDTTPYSRPAIPDDAAGQPPGAGGAGPTIIRVIDAVVNNTDPNLKNTDTFGDGEVSIAINPSNPTEIVMSAFSGCWTNCGTGANTPLWVSTDDGQTWTKEFTVPLPPGAGGTAGCPCDQTFDYGPNNVLFGVFLTASPDNLYTGSTTDPTTLASWAWWLSGGAAQQTNLAATSIGNADQPFLFHNRGTTNASFQNVYVAYDDFGTNPVNMRVSASINKVPPQFPSGSDQLVGSASGAINPGHRLASDPRNGWMYSLHQNCITNCATLAANPKTIQYFLNRSTDQGATWTLNGSSTGIVVATADSTQPQPKFGTVNALLGGVEHGAVDPSTGDLYYVYGNRDASGNNRLAIRRVFDNGSGGVNIGAESFVVSGTVTAALPSVAVTSHGAVGVFYYTYNGMVSGFPQFTTWLAVSTDQGATFSTQALATFLSPATDNGDGRQRVFGDYMQMKAIGDCFDGGFTGNGAAFGRSVSNNDPIFFKACMPAATNTHNTHDFNGDGKSDIAWRGPTGDLSIWLMNGTQILSAPDLGNVPTNWTIVGQRPLNNSGFADLLWRGPTGDLSIWFMNGTQILSTADFGTIPTSWSIVGTSAFNASNGYAELFWRDTAGDLSIWQINGAQILSAPVLGNVPPSWTIAGIGDFSGTGAADILWRGPNGDVAIWFMNGTQIVSSPDFINVPLSWTIVGTGDFNGDGKTDILWRDTAGDVAIWLMKGTQILSSAILANVSTSWTIAETGDFNGDGYSDILWRGPSGDVAIWFMNGTQIVSSPDFINVPTSWTIQGANAD